MVHLQVASCQAPVVDRTILITQADLTLSWAPRLLFACPCSRIVLSVLYNYGYTVQSAFKPYRYQIFFILTIEEMFRHTLYDVFCRCDNLCAISGGSFVVVHPLDLASRKDFDRAQEQECYADQLGDDELFCISFPVEYCVEQCIDLTSQVRCHTSPRTCWSCLVLTTIPRI